MRNEVKELIEDKGAMANKVVAYFDGLCEPVNPGGVATYGYAIYRAEKEIASGYGYVSSRMMGQYSSNNIAEYSGALAALKKLKELGAYGPVLRGDSKLVVKQLRGEYRVRSPHLQQLYREALFLVEELKANLEWVPRELNKRADELSRIAFEEFVNKHWKAYVSYYRPWLATEKQIRFLKSLGYNPSPWLSKAKASNLIRELIRKQKRKSQ